MKVYELRNILEEFDGEMEIEVAEFGYPDDSVEIERVDLNYKKDIPKMVIIQSQY